MRLRLRLAGLTVLALFAAITPVMLVTDVGVAVAAPPAALPAPVGGVITLAGDCDTTAPLSIPDAVTLNGAGHTITAHDVAPGSFNGAVVTNAGTTMTVENLTIMGTGFTQTNPVGSCGRAALYGIWFNGAGGSVTNVHVTGITEGSNCQVGRAIRGDGTGSQTLTITGTTVSDYNKDGDPHVRTDDERLDQHDQSPPRHLKGITGQNGLVYQDGASGTTSGNTIYGSGFGNTNDQGTALLLFGATGVTLSGNTITGDGTDIGIAVAANSTGVTIDHNKIGRTAPDVPDSVGIGVDVETGSSATVTCNTFTGWVTNVNGIPPQPPCAGPSGYWTVASNGAVAAFGVPSFGSAANIMLSKPIVGMAATPSGNGYWLVAGDGGVFAYGDAPFLGWSGAPGRGYGLDLRRRRLLAGHRGRHRPELRQRRSLRLHRRATTQQADRRHRPHRRQSGLLPRRPPTAACSPSATPTSKDRWAATPSTSRSSASPPTTPPAATGWSPKTEASSPSVRRSSAPPGTMHLNAPIVGIAARNDGQGYWLVAKDGGVFAYGTAPFLGSMGGTRLNQPIVAADSFG